MPIITLSHSAHATARLFSMKSLLVGKEKCIFLTDSEKDIQIMQKFAKEILGAQIKILSDLADFWMMQESSSGYFCIPHALMETGGNIDYIEKHTLYEIKRNTSLPPEHIIEKLIQFGYTHENHGEECGTYKKEGSLISFTDSISENRIHIEWFDTEIDSIIEVNNSTKSRIFRESISIKNKNQSDTPLQRKEGILNTEFINILKNKETPIIIFGCDFLEYIDALRSIAEFHFTDFHRDDTISIGVEVPNIHHIDEFLTLLRSEYNTSEIIFYTKFPKTVQDFLQLNGLETITTQEVNKTGLESCILPSQGTQQKQIVITDDIIGKIFVKKRQKKSIAKHLDLLLTLTPGDIVVHREHGIARFYGVVKKTIGSPMEKGTNPVSREYIELHYADGDKLWVPLTEIYRVSKYLGNTDINLTRLTGKEWEKTMNQTEEEIEKIAYDILETNAKRALAKGHSFAKFREKEKTFREAFTYEHTQDQLQAIEDIFGDMEGEASMDRLISGDVGFGKTEVAMNAIYKAVLSGTQVAVISPLLVLADEHYETFTERFSPFGIHIGILTRMSSQKEVDTTLLGLKNGTIDVIVGTHRLLSEDVHYRRLGLLVIDEEHKFGVTHKEKIKKIKAGIDILTLSATPIPRSLNLALSGVKKISIISTPPKKKKPIETIIIKWNPSVLIHAIRHEIERGGQVIILHNRIRGMESLAKEIETLLRETSGEGALKEKNIPGIIITHGQMPGDEIENRIHAFKRGDAPILLSTTIIENGVNFLSANTILIIDPEEFGLASLHQLRGRVGRKDQNGFCYLIYRKATLGDNEKERLITLANNNHLGAGFEIAMRDMEIRGAGDVLGIKQSGKSKDVGLTLYFRLLEEKIAELREQKQRQVLTKIELDISYMIPDGYFLSEQDKIHFFREIENIEDEYELDEIEQDFLGGKTPDTMVHNVFLLIRTRLILTRYNVEKLSKVGLHYVFDMRADIGIEGAKKFLDTFDTENNFVLLSLKKIRTEVKNWRSAEEFLYKINNI